jgi:hypothetical protein
MNIEIDDELAMPLRELQYVLNSAPDPLRDQLRASAAASIRLILAAMTTPVPVPASTPTSSATLLCPRCGKSLTATLT